jgi:hypothetical protein
MAKSTTKRRVPAAKSTIELVVRRGALRRFHKLTQRTGNLPVKISWDRRLGERRTESGEISADQRKTDRRTKPPLTWEWGDFVVVDPRDDEQ